MKLLWREALRRNAGGREAQGKTASVRPYAFPWRRLAIGLAATLVAALAATSVGPAGIPFTTVVKIVVNKLPFAHLTATWPESWDVIVWQIRLPRVAVAGMVGMALAVSGATYQGVFRNPLADPYLIGVAAGAGLGATALLLTPLPSAMGTFGLVPLAAFVAALAAVSLAYTLARVGGAVPTTTLILAGVAIGSLASAVTAFLLMTSSQDVRPVLSWLLGSFATAHWSQVPILLPYLLFGTAMVLVHSRILNVLQMDEEQARQLGVNVERTKLLLVAASSLVAAAAVSVSGLIGFVGLIAPHTVRLLWGHDYRTLLPMSLVLGGVFLIAADVIARLALSPTEVPVGVVTAFFGAPFFLYLLRQRKRLVM